MKSASLQEFRDVVTTSDFGKTIPPALLLHRSGRLETFYAPFEFVNQRAKVVICGITPGRQQAAMALSVAGQALREGRSVDQALELAKSTASFAGAMRSNLIAMLDYIGVHKVLSIHSTGELFGARVDLVHFTSALRNPVFVGGMNYAGSPPMLSTASARWQIDHYLSEEAKELRNALWIPLGSKVAEVLSHLATRGLLPERHVLVGLPHPSGANAERIAVFLGRKPPTQVSLKTNAPEILMAREALAEKIASLPPLDSPKMKNAHFGNTTHARLAQPASGTTSERVEQQTASDMSKDTAQPTPARNKNNRKPPAIDRELEKQIRQRARDLGFEDTALASDGTHQIELTYTHHSRREAVYVARLVAHSRGQLQVVVSPPIGMRIDESIAEGSPIEIHVKGGNASGGRAIHSSQYRLFDNKPPRGEHHGYAYRLPISDQLRAFAHFLETVKRVMDDM